MGTQVSVPDQIMLLMLESENVLAEIRHYLKSQKLDSDLDTAEKIRAYKLAPHYENMSARV